MRVFTFFPKNEKDTLALLPKEGRREWGGDLICWKGLITVLGIKLLRKWRKWERGVGWMWA